MPNPFLVASGLHRQPGFVLRQAYFAVWGDLITTLEPFGLKPQTYATLLIVGSSPGCKQQDIADALGIQRPNIVAMIDKLVAAGWIARAVNPDDRRSYSLTLTDEGSALLEASRAAHAAHEARAMALLGEDGMGVLIAGSTKLARLAK
jgi:DNA-binding MarR family transcriptional regulator